MIEYITVHQSCYENIVTVQQVCAFTALTVRMLRMEGKNPIGEADLEWIFARNCEGTEQLQNIK